MTNQEHYALFSSALKNKKIVRYENSLSRDDYAVYAIRKMPEGHMFFCRVETFFRSGPYSGQWQEGSLSSFHEFYLIKGAESGSLQLTDNSFVPIPDYKNMLPVLEAADLPWQTVD